jgi:hypothetical protein
MAPIDGLTQSARAVLDDLRSHAGGSKADVQRVMAARRLDALLRERKTLKAVEARALQLIRRPDFARLQPTLVHVSPDDRALWTYLRHTLSSAPWTARPFRASFLLAIDVFTKGVLGIVDVGSDLRVLSPRDQRVGWTQAQRYARLRHSANIGTCVSTEPFGRLTGGKFLASATMSEWFAQFWERKYGDALALVCTTALYGRASIYNRVPGLDYVGDTAGGGAYHLSDAGYETLKRFLVRHGIVARMGGRTSATESRVDVLQRCCALLGVDLDAVSSHQPRGVYCAFRGDDACAFLRGETDTVTGAFPHVDRDAAARWWLGRWHAMRLPKLVVASDWWRAYSVDGQIDRCQALIRGRSICGDASGVQPEEGDSNASRPLHISEETHVDNTAAESRAR